MSGAEPTITIDLIGPFQIRNSDGVDRTPKGRKARALIAMLALSPDYRRSRAWIKAKLWSDRGDEQAAASLRQTLSEIRRALATEAGCLRTESQTVLLEPQIVYLNFGADDGDGNNDDPRDRPDDSELLEDLDARDPEFREWLKEQRQKFHGQDVVENGNAAGNGNLPVRDFGPAAATRLYLTKEVWGERDGTDVLASVVSDMMSKSIKELLAAEVIDERNVDASQTGDNPDVSPGALKLSTELASFGETKFLRISLTNLADNCIVWTDTISDLSRFASEADSSEILQQVNHVANMAARYLGQSNADKRPERLAHHYCQLGISHLFRLGRSNFETADSLFAQAFDLDPRGLYLAWRAYLRLFMHAERQFECRQTLEEEAVNFAAKAMELEPFNSVVNSLAAHVQLTVKRSYAAAYELAEQSVRLNQANCLGWLSLGVAQCQLGQHEEGFKNSLFAREICGPAPYRFQVDGLCCIAATVSGHIDQAAHLGETSHAHSPMFAPALRFLIALYSRQGRTELVYETMAKLKRIEPDFSFELLREDGYPAASLRRTSLLESLPSHEY